MRSERTFFMFTFKQFIVHQDRCAMKVGTDGVLLGAWAPGGQRILDIGTGTGLVAMMMAQRCKNAEIIAIDIDTAACEQACDNINNSPFHRQVNVKNVALQDFSGEFDCIVCNPPFFENSLECPDDARTAARHASSLPFAVLFAKAYSMLSDDGVFSIVIPTDMLCRINEEAALAGFFVMKQLDIKTVERKQPKRTLLAFCKKRPSEVSHDCQVLMVDGQRSPWYSDITKDFYL